MERIAGRVVGARPAGDCAVDSLGATRLLIVLIILLITWFIIRLVKLLLSQVEAGRLQIPGLHPETVGATRKLISVVIWLFALSAAYPFLPGANSLAFKGISVFFGLMLTLGSAES
ncbi:transporter small conductance mechanosensitive ion channel (MscS) family [Raoultella ornithinolytica]|nr:transporter small conductance mechanosensitive ion channel (MscS) family [Raoultella ornithinolytica]